MTTWLLLGGGFGAGLLIAIWGIWNLREPAAPADQEDVADEAPATSGTSVR